ncbi:hypothetical protein RD792_006482 [Penstemon davidsonii]|uniref:glucose-1-phosphate adenylyltransferase n=1 Tax=Penstemon davidsonii TaxID=160366 RepID=A0ABR0DD51_9LAMI|nr:hypothetical protein RD792_006482 [Penstemon davidsonii]
MELYCVALVRSFHEEGIRVAETLTFDYIDTTKLLNCADVWNTNKKLLGYISGMAILQLENSSMRRSSGFPRLKLLQCSFSLQNCKIHHSVVGLRSCISEGAVIEDTLLMGADYYETDADRTLLAAKGSVPIGIGKNTHIKRAIIDKNARIGENVKIINSDNVQEAARETDGYFIKSGIVTVIKDALIPSGTVI